MSWQHDKLKLFGHNEDKLIQIFWTKTKTGVIISTVGRSGNIYLELRPLLLLHKWIFKKHSAWTKRMNIYTSGTCFLWSAKNGSWGQGDWPLGEEPLPFKIGQISIYKKETLSAINTMNYLQGLSWSLKDVYLINMIYVEARGCR